MSDMGREPKGLGCKETEKIWEPSLGRVLV